MTPFGGVLKDDEVAAVFTYVRNDFGNKAPAVQAAQVSQVSQVREATKARQGFYIAQDLLKEHPLE